MLHDLRLQKKIPRTILLTPQDAQSLGLPKWTKQFLGMKVVIADNLEQSKIVPDFYETISFDSKKNKANTDAAIREGIIKPH